MRVPVPGADGLAVGAAELGVGVDAVGCGLWVGVYVGA